MCVIHVPLLTTMMIYKVSNCELESKAHAFKAISEWLLVRIGLKGFGLLELRAENLQGSLWVDPKLQ